MAKRLFAMLLVVAMLMSFMPVVGVAAEGELDKHTSHEGWTEWTDKTKLPTAAGQYYLSVDVNLTAVWEAPNGVHLCLDGHTITQKTANHRVLNVNAGKTISIYDCAESYDANGNYVGGKLTGGTKENGTAVWIDRSGAVFNLYGGRITGNANAEKAAGGAIYLRSGQEGKAGAVFNMYGGEIVGNGTSGVSTGGAVQLHGEAAATRGDKPATFNMYGGLIQGNLAKEGGAIYAIQDAVVNIQGGKLLDNKSTGSGGAICAKQDVVVTVANTQISGNQGGNAGAIYGQNQVKLTIKDSVITGNKATSTSAEGYGAAIYMCGSSSKIVLEGEVTVAHNTVGNPAIADVFINSTDNNGNNEKLYVKDLEGGYVKFGIKDKAASVTEASDVVVWEGAASTYSDGAISYMAGEEEKHVGLVDGSFRFIEGHFHDGVKYEKWTDGAKLPSSGAYYLDTDVTLLSKDNRAVVDGGATLHLCLNGKTVTQNIPNAGTSEATELIRVSNGSLYLDDCTTKYDENGYFVSGGKLAGADKKGNGSALYINKATSVVEVTGVEFAENNSTVTSVAFGGAAVMARYNTTPAKFIGCKFSENTAASTGAGAIALRDGGSVEAEKCYFYKNSAKEGGAIYVYESKLSLKDCLFEENSANNGGAITTATDTKKTTTNTVLIEGCTFEKNTAANAGAINIGGVTNITVKDCSITGNTNTSTAGYGAVNLSNSNANVYIQGDTVIYDNLNKDGKQQNLHAQQYEGVDYDLSGLGSDAKIGVSLIDSRITAGYMFFSTKGMTAVPSGVSSDDAAYKVVVDTEGRLALAENEGGEEPPVLEGHTHKLCNDASCTKHGDNVTFEAWDKTDSLPTEGNYYLTEDVTLTDAMTTTGALNLCLNGHTVKQTTSGKRLIVIAIGHKLSVTDCGTTGQLTGGTQTYGSAISVRHGTTFNLFGGKITGNSNASEGTVYIQGGNSENPAGIFNMYGGEISGNTTKYGGAVSASAPASGVTQVAQINIYGGKITGNTASTSDTSTGRGGAINASGKAIIYIENAEISGNTTEGEGGAIYATSGCEITVKNAKIKNNSGKSASAISTYGGKLTLDGAVIEGNTATGGYSAVHAHNSATAGKVAVTLKGATVIDGNTNNGNAMNLYLRSDVAADVSGLTDSARIGLTWTNDRSAERFSKAALGSAAQLNRFYADNAEKYEAAQDDEGYLILKTLDAAPDHLHKLCCDSACTDHANVAFKAWDKTDSLPASGTYYLTADVTLTAKHTISDDLTLCLNGHTITQTAKDRVLQTADKKTLTITDCQGTGVIRGGRNNTGSAVFIAEGTTFNMYGGKITDNSAADASKAQAAAPIFLRSTDGPDATFNMYGGEISGNGYGMSWAGAITNASGNKTNTVYVNIYGGKIYGNMAGTGGAIRMEKKSVTTIYGGEIYDNEATGNGGAIYLSSGNPELVIKGGTINGNAAANGGGIYVSSGAKVTIEGAPTIYDNTASDKQNNIYLVGDDTITLGALESSAKIGIGAATANRAVTTTVDTDYSANFRSDNSNLTVAYKGKAIWLTKVEVSDHYHCVCTGVKNDVCDHTEQMWIKWGDDADELTSLPTTSGYYYLVENITLSGEFVIGVDQNVSLCLNGKTVTQTTSGKRHYASNNRAVLNITDCSENVGGLTGGNRTYGGSINVVAGSTVNLFAGKIYGNTSNEGGGVYLQGSKVSGSTHIAGGIFNMYGGEISGNTATTNGAGVKSAGIGGTGEKDPSIVNIYGGKITGNEAVETVTVNAETGEETVKQANGGGIAATEETSVNLYGGIISGNTAAKQGGGIQLEAGAKLLIEGGKIEGNESASVGGGIFATGVGTEITLNSGEICGNKSANGGGMITQTRAFFTMNGGKICHNESTSNGAGLYVSTNTDFVMNGGQISENHSGSNGAGFYALRSRVTLDNGVQIINNTAGNRAGAFASSGGTIVLNKCTISGNSAKEGGAAYINRTSSGSGENVTYYPSVVTINDGALITANKGESNTGGFLIANDDVVVTMNGGEFSKNTAENGAAIMTWRGSTFVLKGGKIVNNTAKSSAAVYISTASKFVMEGGSISNNNAKTAAGVYVLRADADLSGGTISYNRAQHTSTWKNGKESKSGGTGGAMYISGGRVNFRGTSVVGNYSTVNGGAIMCGRASYKENGVTKYELVRINVYGGLFSDNKTEGAGGAMLIQSEGTVVNVYGGTFTRNEAKNAGAIYVSTKTTFNMSGGTITRNHSNNYAGALYFLNSTGTITGGQIYDNTATANSGLIIVSGEPAVLKIKNMKLHDGVSKTAGAMVVQSKGHVYAENCDFYDNKADGGTGGAVYISNNSFGDFTDCKFYNNTSDNSSGAIHGAINSKINITRCDFTENSTKTNGGVMYANPKTVINITDSTFSKNTAGDNGGALVCRATMYLTNVTLENNTAENGGAIATDTNNTGGAGVRDGLVIKNSEIRNNTASAQGGALYIWKGRTLETYDTKITGNTAGLEGGAIWSYEDVRLHDTTITGNTSGGEGYAVYMNDANYDGHSYYTSKNKLSGDVIIKDNEGGNLWMGPDVVFAITADGLGENVHIELELDSGVVTQRILGAYHYEGGNQVYTITYGDKSMTDPEYDASLANAKSQQTQEKSGSADVLLYVGIGVIGLAAVAAVVLIATKKKKSAPAEKN